MSSRHGTKYRPSLSCNVCRRRKVKCGKETPTCGNCARMNEVCEYDRAPNVEERRQQGPLTPKPRKRSRSPVESSPSRWMQKVHPTNVSILMPPGVSPIRGYFSSRDKFRPRHVNNTFWAYVPGEDSVCDEILSQEHKTPVASRPLINMHGLLGLMTALPSKSISDVLFSSFMIGARPLHCLINESSLRGAYETSLKWGIKSDSIRLPYADIFLDPTIMCVVFSVLYCGAIIAPPSLWASPVLKGLDAQTTTDHLRGALYTSLEHVQYRNVPTLNTLAALLLTRSCAKKPSEPPLEDTFFFNVVVQMAHSMGLQREDVLSKMDSRSREFARRIYWHIRWLDVQASITNGTDVFCGCSESLYDTKIPKVGGIDDSAINDGVGFDIDDSDWIEGPASKLFAIGRFEVVRFLRSLFHIAIDLDQMECARIDSLTDALDKLHVKMDALILQIPADGIPEKGMIPSRLANASPSTHERLYMDDSTEPTVFGSWARIVLSVFKNETSIILHKLLLGRTDFSKESVTWDILVEYCLMNLRYFIQLVQTPAFQPYLWFSMTRCAPLQVTNLCIIYLQRSPPSEKRQLVQYFVDEVIDFYTENKAMSCVVHSKYTVPAAWKMLKLFRVKADGQPGTHQSLDDLATQALASAASSVIRDTPDSEDTTLPVGSSSHSVSLGEIEPSEQEITECCLATTELTVSHDNTSCSEDFKEISEDFFMSIDPQHH